LGRGLCLLEYDSGVMADDDRIAFQNRMHEVKRALLALDEVSNRDTLASVVKAVARGKIAYTHLQRHQNSVKMTAEEAHQLETAMDVLQARLNFFGEKV
jgi:hypothetical protein